MMTWLKLHLDKLFHFSISFLVMNFMFVVAHNGFHLNFWWSLGIGFGVSVVVGGTKEALDSRGLGEADWMDMVANCLGITLGVIGEFWLFWPF